MNRNFFCPVLILSSRQFGEDNRIFTVLTQEYGVFDAVLYGGRKSKLRSVCSPYHYGTMWFYDLADDAGIYPLKNPANDKPMGFLDWFEYYVDKTLEMEENDYFSYGELSWEFK